MIKIILPDGKVLQSDKPLKGFDIAAKISKTLEKSAIAIKINGQLKDLSDEVNENSEISIITLSDPEGLDIMRHTIAAQVLGKAIKNLYPNARLAIGPTIKDGFYYDVDSDSTISSDDLETIEKEMLKIVAEGNKIIKKTMPKNEAIALFRAKKENYKVSIIEDAQETNFQIYFQGETGFVDLCRGPHLPSLRNVGAFKLMKVAGAYWHGDSKNKMLTRIYGTAWAKKDELNDYLHMMEEAEKRDHRKICQTMDLLHFQAEAPGQVFWHDRGWTIYRELENYIRGKLKAKNYTEVNTPRIINKSLFVQSGHWEKFGTDEMFISEAYGSTYALKPMNCPCHVQIFKHSLRSYKDLPIKMSEFGNCMRQEARGALHGLMRVASMTQDDAHIFCSIEQIKEQVLEIYSLICEIYKELGFKDFFVRFSDRPVKRVGDDSLWDKAERALIEAAEEAGIKWVLNKGEGAFYGPKLEFVLTDSIKREWQCGTIQLDFNLPRRLDATFIDKSGEKQFPVMIHRALLGSMERFLGIFIEHYAGNLPLWITPVQLVISGITDKHLSYTKELVKKFKERGIRVLLDERNEKISYKVREHFLAKVPYMGVIGDQEIQNKTISVRKLGSEKQENLLIEDFLNIIQTEIHNKTSLTIN